MAPSGCAWAGPPSLGTLVLSILEFLYLPGSVTWNVCLASLVGMASAGHGAGCLAMKDISMGIDLVFLHVFLLPPGDRVGVHRLCLCLWRKWQISLCATSPAGCVYNRCRPLISLFAALNSVEDGVIWRYGRAEERSRDITLTAINAGGMAASRKAAAACRCM